MIHQENHIPQFQKQPKQWVVSFDWWVGFLELRDFLVVVVVAVVEKAKIIRLFFELATDPRKNDQKLLANPGCL